MWHVCFLITEFETSTGSADSSLEGWWYQTLQIKTDLVLQLGKTEAETKQADITKGNGEKDTTKRLYCVRHMYKQKQGKCRSSEEGSCPPESLTLVQALLIQWFGRRAWWLLWGREFIVTDSEQFITSESNTTLLFVRAGQKVHSGKPARTLSPTQ